MIKIEKPRTYGWQETIRGMRNPLDSWAKMDSTETDDPTHPMNLGPQDMSLMWRLMNAGSNDHCKFRRMLSVYVDVTAPLYWWKEADTYKVGTVANSCSTMHTIHKHPFTRNMFSHDQLDEAGLAWLDATIDTLNAYRDAYLVAAAEKNEIEQKKAWYNIIQVLPSSFMQKRTLELNYEVLANMYHSRLRHKLYEWREFCRYMTDNLPYAWIFTKEKPVELS